MATVNLLGYVWFLENTFLFLYSCSLVFFGGRISHPSLVLLFSFNISLCRFLSKKKKKKLRKEKMLKKIILSCLVVL